MVTLARQFVRLQIIVGLVTDRSCLRPHLVVGFVNEVDDDDLKSRLVLRIVECIKVLLFLRLLLGQQQLQVLALF